MNSWQEILDDFVVQVQKGDLKTSSYPKEYSDLKMKVGFGQGQAARVPWIAILAPEMQVSNGFYPVYLYYKEDSMLILAYGISETSEYFRSWPDEIMSSSQTIREYFDKEVPRYGDSFVYKAYQIEISNDDVKYLSPDDKKNLSHMSIEKDLETILDQYKKIVSVEIKKEDSPLCQGLFYMEKQLEDFIIHNWENTELGKRYELIIEDGEIVSQQ